MKLTRGLTFGVSLSRGRPMKLIALAVLIALPALSACGPRTVGNSTPAAAGNMEAAPAPASIDSPTPSKKRREIDFGLKEIHGGTYQETVVKKLGKPLKLKKIKRGERCSDGLNHVLEYPGLTIETIYDSESGVYTVLTIEISSEEWPIEPGFAIGSEIGDVLAKIGEPTSRSEDERFLVLRYETELYTDIALLYFENGKLSKAKFGNNRCLDEN